MAKAVDEPSPQHARGEPVPTKLGSLPPSAASSVSNVPDAYVRPPTSHGQCGGRTPRTRCARYTRSISASLASSEIHSGFSADSLRVLRSDEEPALSTLAGKRISSFAGSAGSNSASPPNAAIR